MLGRLADAESPPSASRRRASARELLGVRAAEIGVSAALHDAEQRPGRARRAGQRGAQGVVARRPPRLGAGAPDGGHTSSAMAMSAPSAAWTRMAASGVRRCACRRGASGSDAVVVEVRRSRREKTWKPPESVSMAPCQPMKRCRPPSARDELGAGTQAQVVGVAEDDRRAESRAARAGVERLHGRLGADGHERGGLHVAVGGVHVPVRAAPSVASTEKAVIGRLQADVIPKSRIPFSSSNLCYSP